MLQQQSPLAHVLEAGGWHSSAFLHCVLREEVAGLLLFSELAKLYGPVVFDLWGDSILQFAVIYGKSPGPRCVADWGLCGTFERRFLEEAPPEAAISISRKAIQKSQRLNP